ncbi:MAG: chemotaxis-specific protein-glutamate methyltransferase CheB [Candidatus Krumholzibacteriota bacterium]|nr:chemotaxis-specific protein-glutamate methyltransferase CheB [Candidatus Krumholzibacteriota bacterium]
MGRNKPGRKNPIRVVVGEDSQFMRKMITDSLNSDPDIEVVGIAGNGREVLRVVNELDPDCITLDLEMPCMDGLETLRYIMSEWPTPVVILSAHSGNGARMAITCLEYGAVDFVAKTAKGHSFPVEELIAKVKMAAEVNAGKVRFAPTNFDLRVKSAGPVKTPSDYVVVIGASTGGPQALMEIIPRLPARLEAGVLIVQHMPPNFTRYLAERMDAESEMSVREAEEEDTISPGTVLVAPGGMHLFMEECEGVPTVMLLSRNNLQRTACPSIDFTLTSFAPHFREKLVAVILTGMGKDGTTGCMSVKRYGGRVICQDRETSMIYGMPGEVSRHSLVDEVVPLDDMADCIVKNIEHIRVKEFSNGS